jgi:hypothetical protein
MTRGCAQQQTITNPTAFTPSPSVDVRVFFCAAGE